MSEKINIPSIGAAKGLFEMLVPGAFLLLNLGFFLNYISGQHLKDSPLFDIAKDNTVLVLVIIIVLGYLTGVVLWLAGAEFPDKFSAWLRRSEPDTFYKEDFPYIDSLGSIGEKYLPKEANDFYTNCWKPRNMEKKNKYFFNYCKTLINAIDQKSTFEISSNEALIRYIAAMFYALLISLFFVMLIFLIELNYSCLPYIYGLKLWVLNQSSLPCPFPSRDPALLIDSGIFILFYAISIIALLWRLRYMRFKEVQTVFVASLINKKKIGHYLSDNPLCTQPTEQKTTIDWNNTGWALNSQGKYEEAINAYDKAIEINPRLAEAWHNKGTALKSLGRTTEANAAFAKAKELGYKD